MCYKGHKGNSGENKSDYQKLRPEFTKRISLQRLH
jgi:hypothetical protein